METYITKAACLDKKSIDIKGTLNTAGVRFHFIGAGGIGMSGLAKLLIKNKAIVSGSDRQENGVTKGLGRIGAEIRIGHNAENLVAETDAVVISAAIKEDNPELKRARAKGIKVYKYAEMLGALMNSYAGVAVAGTHGKSTTTGWLVHLLKEAGVGVNFIVGADIPQLAGSSGVGDSEYFAVEACEYDRSFLNLGPKIACILNIEQDHLDYYKDEQEIVGAFGEFAGRLEPGGVLIANGQDANAAKVIDSLPAETGCKTFGIDGDYDFSARNVELKDGLYCFDVYRRRELLGCTGISLPGEHNVLNGLAVIAMADTMGLEAERILELLPEFNGIDRRLMLKGRIGEVTVLDDYAHHPTEIRASLRAIRQRYTPERIWCVFQPHQYSRTRFLLDDFAESFKLADVTIVPEIYFVRDTQAAKKEVNSQILVERINGNGSKAVFVDGFGAICEYLRENVGAGDLVVTMGAGDIWKVADEYIQWLGRNY